MVVRKLICVGVCDEQLKHVLLITSKCLPGLGGLGLSAERHVNQREGWKFLTNTDNRDVFNPRDLKPIHCFQL